MIAGVLSSHSILLENAPLITFFTFSLPQALEQPDHFHAGGARKKRSLVRCKSVKSCARPYPPCEAQPRRVALMLRLAAAEQSACLGMPPQRHPCKTTLTEQVRLEMLARHRLLNKQVHVPTVAHLNAAAVSNTAIAPSSSLLASATALEPPQRRRPTCCHSRPCSRRRRRRAAIAAVSLLPPRLGCAAAGHSHTCAFRKLPLCSSIHLGRAKFSSPSR